LGWLQINGWYLIRLKPSPQARNKNFQNGLRMRTNKRVCLQLS
jgi:hypothetical protein